MPDGAVPNSVDAIATALDAARVNLEEHLSQLPEWAAYQASQRTSATDAARLEARLAAVPAFQAFRQLRTAVSLLPLRDAGFQLASVDQPVSQRALRPAAPPTPPTPPADQPPDAIRDDLTRIRGIDSVLARRLSAIGIARYAQIAAWEHEDVRTIAQALGLGREFVRYGVIEQANWLEAERLAKLALRQAPALSNAKTPRLTSVAVWTPRTAAAANAVDSQPALMRATGAAEATGRSSVVAAVARLRVGCAMNQIIALAKLAPELDQPVFIAVDIDAAVEVPAWRSVPLAPFGETATADAPVPSEVATPAARLSDQSAVSISPALMSSGTDANRPAPEAPAPPLHEQAGRRLADLEAELDALAVAWQPVDKPATLEVALRQPTTAQPVVLNSLAEPRAPMDYAAMPDVDEADVQIVATRRPHVSPLAPLPDLPLTARHAADRPASAVATLIIAAESGTLGFGAVEEAAVVIVSRDSPVSAIADLAFYARGKTETSPQPSQRFLQALLGA